MIEEQPISADVNKLAVFLRESTFRTPPHQRPYDWDAKAHVFPLLEDLHECINADKPYYFLGEVIFIAPPKGNPPEGEGRLYINDGQQRITTFMLICANLCRHFHGRRGSGESDALRLLFNLPEGHGKTLADTKRFVNSMQRIKLAESDQEVYEMLTCGESVKKNGKMKKAWDEINTFFSHPQYKKTSAKKKFFDGLLNKVKVSRLYFKEAEDAIPIFEKRNARGKPLDEIQLVCTHFLYCVQGDKARSNRVHNQISAVRNNLRNDEKQFADYARCFFQSRYGHLSAKRFYRDLKKAVQKATNESDEISRLVEEMSEDYRIGIFNSLVKKTVEESWNRINLAAGKNQKPRKMTDFLKDLSGYGKVSHPIMFALLCEYADTTSRRDKRKVASFVCDSSELLAAFIQRTIHTVPSFATSRYEEGVAKLARGIASGECATPKDFLVALRAMDEQKIISDTQYIDKMGRTAYDTDSARKKAKYVLARISERIQKGLTVPDSKTTLEHILPHSTHYLEGWGLSYAEHLRCVHRLGNLTLLPPDYNKTGKDYNGSYAAKKADYAQSAYDITKRIPDQWDEWNEKSINERQEKLAADAARVWSLTLK